MFRRRPFLVMTYTPGVDHGPEKREPILSVTNLGKTTYAYEYGVLFKREGYEHGAEEQCPMPKSFLRDLDRGETMTHIIPEEEQDTLRMSNWIHEGEPFEIIGYFLVDGKRNKYRVHFRRFWP